MTHPVTHPVTPPVTGAVTRTRQRWSTAHRRLPLPVGAVASLLVASLALVGCGSDQPTRTTSGSTGRLTDGLPVASTDGPSAPSSATEGRDGGEGPDVSDTPDPALSGQPVPTLPPGDPGADDSTATPDAPPGPVATIPAEAMLDAPTVGAVAGGSWTAAEAPAGWCATPHTPGARVDRAQVLTTDGGRLLETVSSHADRAAARRAVDRAATRLVACGWTLDHDPRLGEASEQLTRSGGDGPEVALVLAADGVGVVLVAVGTAAAQGTWESLADLALGSSCLAADEGCH